LWRFELTRRFNLTPQTVTLFVPKSPPVRYAVELGVSCHQKLKETMEAKDIYTLLISACAVLMSAYIVFGEYKRRQPSLAFFNRFRKNAKELFLEIVVTNTSSNSIDLIEAGYYLGDSEAFRSIPMKKPTTLESGKSASFLVSWLNDTKHTILVEKFHFTSSTGETFVHSLGRSIAEELKLQLFIHQTPQTLFELEKLHEDFEKSMSNFEESLLVAEEAMVEYESIEKDN
jgi:hypothetical protein